MTDECALESLGKLDPGFEAIEGMGLRSDFSEVIRQGLKQRGWTQRKLAELSGFSESLVNKLVHEKRNCRLSTTAKAVHALGFRAELRLIQTKPPSREREGVNG